VTVSPGSAASHAALLSGRYPVSNGVFANFSVMDPSVATLAEFLRERGYRTGGFVTNTFLGRRFGFDQGFDTYVESGRVERLAEPSPAALWRSLALVQVADRLRARLDRAHDPSFETALAWIRESPRPAFFFVHLMDVHSPYAPPHPYGPRFGADPDAGAAATRRRNRLGWRPSESAYAAEIRFADGKVGRLRRTLEELDLLDSSVIAVTSDHGENLTDHEPNFSHGVTQFDATLRVLLLFRAPSAALARGIVPSVAENVDVPPTLASLLSREPHPDWEGRSFHPGRPPERLPTFSQLGRDFAARTPGSKLVLRTDGTHEYYRLDQDPGETRPVALADGERARIEAEFARWFERYATPLYREHAKSIAPSELPEDVVEKLKALGYVE
jgi:arylsulfatase A-like enzyme